MSKVLIGAKPRPRLLVFGIDRNEELGRAVCYLAPTIRFIESVAEFRRIRQKEWDAAVTRELDYNLDKHLFVIQFGDTSYIDKAIMETNKGSIPVDVHTSSTSYATEFRLPDSLGDIAPLVRTDLLPLVQSRQSNTVMGPRSVIRPFLLDADDKPLAGSFTRANSDAKYWWLPEGLMDPSRWIAAALKEWSKISPECFPSDPLWTENEEWQTPNELAVRDQLAASLLERDRVLREFDEEETRLRTLIDTRQRESDTAERRLLTAQGDDLCDEVRAALEELGFDATDVDQEIATKGDLLEDLRVQDPDEPEWVALAEVRGYTSGAKLSDLQRIGRFVERYISAEGRPPSARWYVVNHHLNQDPSTRPTPLSSNPEDVDIFAQSDGLVIDTRWLFKLRMRVRRGEIEGREARRSLREVRGWYELG